MPVADRDDLRHVDLDRARHVRGRVERAAHVLGDAAAHRVHRLERTRRRRQAAPVGRRVLVPGPAGAVSEVRGPRRGQPLPDRAPATPRATTAPASTKASMSFFVTRPPRPVPSICCRVDAVLGRDARDDRRDEVMLALGAAVPGMRGRGGSGRRRLGRRCRRRLDTGPLPAARAPRAGSGSGSGAAGAAGGRAFAADAGQHRADLDRLALLHDDLAHDARAGARHLGVDLVGRDLEQRLVGLDRVADVLEPAA